MRTYAERVRPLSHPRSLEASREILRRIGVTDPAALGEEDIDDEGYTSEDRLGCSLEAHRRWLRSARADELRSWARYWRPDAT